MSKLLTQIDAQLSQAIDDARRGELLAKKAGYLARIGSFDEAQALIAEIRLKFGDGRSVRVSIWVMLAEGLLHTFREMSDEGADRIMRANALASATRDRELIASTSAWRAFTQSERSEFKGMARSLDHAFANSDSTDHEVLARLYMILGNAQMSIGDRVKAYEYYMLSRHHAIECGDQATIDAVIYNKAAFALAWQRARMCFGEVDAEYLRQLRIELMSAKAYQQMVGISALANFVQLWQARLLMLAGEFAEAVAALRDVRPLRPFADYNYNVALVDLEIAYCLVCAEQHDAAIAEVSQSMGADLSGLHDDDKLVAAWVRTKILEALPQLGDPKLAALALDAARSEFEAGCLALREALGGLAAHPHIQKPTVVQLKAPL